MNSRLLLIALLATAPVARAQVSQSEYRQRRDSVLARTGDGVVLALGTPR